MSRKPIAISILAALMLLFVATRSSANLITYNTGTPNRSRVMVMDETGANPTQLYERGKFSGLGGFLTISPPGPDGTWVAFSEVDLDVGAGGALYKVRADGSGLDKVLCSEGADSWEGNVYPGLYDAQWSPDGTEILVQTLSYLALLPADFAVGLGATGPGCASPALVPIHCYDWGVPHDCITPGSEWTMEGNAAWNDDGSQIAFFELDSDHRIRLVILERQETGGWEPWDPIYPRPENLPVDWPLQLDWQRGGSVLAFVSRVETGRRPNFWLTLIDAATGVWGYMTEGGNPLKGFSPSWSPDGLQLIFTDSRGNLVKWTHLDGSTEAMGPGEDADWQRNPLVITCEHHSDCDDWNECTVGSCIEGECDNLPVADHTPCSSGAGICCGGLCSTTICKIDEDCNDNDVCTDDSCYNPNTCNAYCNSVFEPTNDPSCECLPKGASCISNDKCCSGMCHPRKGTCK